MDVIKHFNLPRYVKGKSFSEASKFIAKKFEGRTSPEDIATLNDLQGRLQQAQEYIKQENAKLSQPQGGENEFNNGGKLGPGDSKYPANPQDLIDSFQSNKEATSYSNPYPNRSNRWEMFDAYQKGISSKSMDTGNNQTVNTGRKNPFTSDSGFKGGKLKSELEIEKKMAGRVKPTAEQLALTDQKMIANQINNPNSYNFGGALGSGIGNIIGAAGGAVNLANMAFGDTGIDTSGKTAGQEVNMGSQIAGGALSGAQLGGAIVPGLGHAIGAVGGGLMGILGGNRKKNDVAKASFNNAIAKNKELANRYDDGGPLDTDPDPDNFNFIEANDNLMSDKNSGAPYATGVDLNSNPITAIKELSGKKKWAVNQAKKYSTHGTTEDSNKNNLWDTIKNKAGNVLSATGKKAGDVLSNPENLRYAPAAMNAIQLAGLKKPEDVAFDRLNTKYDKQLVDEQGLQNTVRQATASNRDALLNSAGGSGSKARAALLASQLQGTKALSQAYQQAGAENRQEGRREQEFNTNIDRTNLQQANMSKNVNLQQDAAYQTNKSRLLSQIGQDLGSVGTEELYKRFPELMGLNYDWTGKHKKKKKKTKTT